VTGYLHWTRTRHKNSSPQVMDAVVADLRRSGRPHRRHRRSRQHRAGGGICAGPRWLQSVGAPAMSPSSPQSRRLCARLTKVASLKSGEITCAATGITAAPSRFRLCAGAAAGADRRLVRQFRRRLSWRREGLGRRTRCAGIAFVGTIGRADLSRAADPHRCVALIPPPSHDSMYSDGYTASSVLDQSI